MKKSKTIINIILLSLCVLFTACSKFLDVEATDRIMESELFSSTAGFQTALNGIYIELASDVLYGKEMSAGIIDVEAQYYFAGINYQSYKTLAYTNSVPKAYFDALWQKYYNLIANANTVVEKCNTTNVLSERYNNIIKGEAIALRAFLHFDVMRLWGPIYSNTTRSATSIPYYRNADQTIQPLLSAENVLDSITTDLTQALSLLEASDPVTTEGRKNAADPVNGDFLSFRQYRLNYFAVKALLARVYLWKQMRTEALATALDVIKQCQQTNQFFPFVSADSAKSSSNPDRLFSSEILFATYDNTRSAMFNSIIAPGADGSNRLYIQGTIGAGRINEMYDDAGDYRIKCWGEVPVGSTTALYNRKYEDIYPASGTASAYNYYIPLLRISEMYLIAAECAGTVTDANGYLNKIRAARSARDIAATDQTTLTKAIRDEYRREFLSEGQLFFYYKRNSLTSVPDGATASSNAVIDVTKYVIPMVDSEINQRSK